MYYKIDCFYFHQSRLTIPEIKLLSSVAAADFRRGLYRVPSLARFVPGSRLPSRAAEEMCPGLDLPLPPHPSPYPPENFPSDSPACPTARQAAPHAIYKSSNPHSCDNNSKQSLLQFDRSIFFIFSQSISIYLIF